MARKTLRVSPVVVRAVEVMFSVALVLGGYWNAELSCSLALRDVPGPLVAMLVASAVQPVQPAQPD